MVKIISYVESRQIVIRPSSTACNRMNTFILLSLDPDAKKGPFKAAVDDPIFPLLLLTAVGSPALEAASLIAAVADSGAQAIHSTTWSCSRKSALHSLVCVAQILTD